MSKPPIDAKTLARFVSDEAREAGFALEQHKIEPICVDACNDLVNPGKARQR